MARSTRTTRTTVTAETVAAPSTPASNAFPSFTSLVAAGAAAKSKEAWKQQAATFCKYYNETENLQLGIDDLVVGGAYHHAFKQWQALQ